MPILVAVWSSTVTPSGIAGSNPAGDMNVSLSCEGCVFSRRGLRIGLITRPEASCCTMRKKLLKNDNYDILYNSEQIYILRGTQCAGCI